MLILSLIQSIFALAFILLGLVALFGLGITGLLFLVPGAVFAAIAGYTQEKSRAAVAMALAADAVLANMAGRKLVELLAPDTADIKFHHTIGALAKASFLDYLVPSAVLVLVGIGAIGVAMDWRALRKAAWF